MISGELEYEQIKMVICQKNLGIHTVGDFLSAFWYYDTYNMIDHEFGVKKIFFEVIYLVFIFSQKMLKKRPPKRF